MKKLLLFLFVLFVISIVACKPVAKETMEKKEGVTKAPAETTGEAAVDAVGNDLNTVNSIEKDLSADELSDLDAGLSDVQNI